MLAPHSRRARSVMCMNLASLNWLEATALVVAILVALYLGWALLNGERL